MHSSPFWTDITKSSLSEIKRGSYIWVKLWLSHFQALLNLLTGSHHSHQLLQAAFVIQWNLLQSIILLNDTSYVTVGFLLGNISGKARLTCRSTVGSLLAHTEGTKRGCCHSGQGTAGIFLLPEDLPECCSQSLTPLQWSEGWSAASWGSTSVSGGTEQMCCSRGLREKHTRHWALCNTCTVSRASAQTRASGFQETKASEFFNKHLAANGSSKSMKVRKTTPRKWVFSEDRNITLLKYFKISQTHSKDL